MKWGSLFAGLRLRRTRASDDEPARFAPPRIPERGAAHTHPFHAVSVRPGLLSCPQARKVRGVRFLSRSAPSVPLPGCDMAGECTCHFDKHNDRRQGDRRLFGCQVDGRYYGGVERRRTGGRRSTDPRWQAS